jgi:hypothetical protein
MQNTDERSDRGGLQSNQGSLSALNDCCGMPCGRLSVLIVVFIILIEWLLREAQGARARHGRHQGPGIRGAFPKKTL